MGLALAQLWRRNLLRVKFDHQLGHLALPKEVVMKEAWKMTDWRGHARLIYIKGGRWSRASWRQRQGPEFRAADLHQGWALVARFNYTWAMQMEQGHALSARTRGNGLRSAVHRLGLGGGAI
jgi:hypothetical protein